MNSLFLETGEVNPDGTFSLEGARAREVFEANHGERRTSMKASLRGESRGVVSIAEWTSSQIRGVYSPTLKAIRRESFSLLVGAARPQATKRIISLAVQLGASEVAFVLTSRAQKSYLSSKVFQPETLDQLVRRALEQAQDSTPPEVRRYWSLEHALEELHATHKHPELLYADTAAHFASRVPLPPLYSGAPPESHKIVAIGPEAGWGTTEVDLFTTYNGKVVWLGERILTVDVACAVGLSLYCLPLKSECD